jgi:hypothetical protein
MADTKTQPHRETKEKKPQMPEQNPKRPEEHRAEQGQRPGAPEFQKQPAESNQPGKQREEKQHQGKHQGEKMPQQQKKDDQGGCGCG